MADLTIVGSGFYGLTVARLAAEAGRTVHVIEARDHIGGNAWSRLDPDTGIEVHPYGTHIWHTSNDRVQAFAERFTTFTPYRHTVWTRSQGRMLPLPITLATIAALTGHAVTPAEGRAWVSSHLDTRHDQSTLRGRALATIGAPLWDALIAGYTAKQWQTNPDELPADVIQRLPIRYTYDIGYFTDRYQGMPTHGYGTWLTRLADHPRIHVTLNTTWTPTDLDGPTVYSGPIDTFHGEPGALTWRTLDFQWEHPTTGDWQGHAVINEADLDVPWTRTHEFHHLHPERDHPTDRTVIARELSRHATPTDEPFYPVRGPADLTRLTHYRDQATTHHPHVIFGGRLGSYQYLDMHMAIASAHTAWDNTASHW